MKENEAIMMDFSENLAFDTQDAVQPAYYFKVQCTIHPICIYYKDNGELKQQSVIIIAESLKHNVEAVHLFLQKLVEYLKKDYRLKKLFIFTDGAPSQYKNRFFFKSLYVRK